MNGPSIEYHKGISADLPRLLAELKELSGRTRPSSDSQRDRAKDIGQPCADETVVSLVFVL